mgnify:CR=1 FL=1
MKTINDVRSFIKQSEADKIVEEIKGKLMKSGEMPVYSDIYKEENGVKYQYVNYVQEGGGVLGVALAGYTYVLEKLGFRFLKLAGTSAGAINTMMIASISKENYPELKNEKIETQSELILLELLNKDLWDLVDGSKFGKWLIKLAITNKSRLKFIIGVIKWSVIYILIYAVFCAIEWYFKIVMYPEVEQGINGVAFGAVTLLIIILITTVYYLFRFKRAHFGLNKGDDFYDWMKNILHRNNINNTADLDKAMESRFEGLTLRSSPLRTSGLESTTKITPPFITIIASDITNQLKVEFPRMAKDYYTSERLNEISPACYVRASMSIPVFFAPFRVTVDEKVIEQSNLQHKGLVATQYSQLKVLKEKIKAYEVHFVDGGVLSNFPISVFHNEAIKIPRMPSFGAKLEDEKHAAAEEIEEKRLSFFPLLYRIFNTVRFNYDKDFLRKNAVYEQCIGHIDVADYNWLDFGLDDETKIAMFKRGAEAAKTFLLGGNVWVKGRQKEFDAFNWEKFKEERSSM